MRTGMCFVGTLALCAGAAVAAPEKQKDLGDLQIQRSSAPSTAAEWFAG